MGTTPTYALPYPELTDQANVPVDMRELAEATDALLTAPGDTGWVAVSINAGFGPLSGQPPMVRRIGKIVYAKGAFSSTGITTAAPYAVGAVPTGYRPSGDVLTRSGTDKGTSAATLIIGANGAVSLRTNGTASTFYGFAAPPWPTD